MEQKEEPAILPDRMKADEDKRAELEARIEKLERAMTELGTFLNESVIIRRI